MQLLSIPHTKVLAKFSQQISIEAKKIKKQIGISHCEAREIWIFENTPFEGSNEFNLWFSEQENYLKLLSEDQDRILCLGRNSVLKNENYLAFKKEVGLFQLEKDGTSKMVLGPSEVTSSSHSFITDNRIWRNMVVRRPTPVPDPKNYIKNANSIGRKVYVINTLESFFKWQEHWGEQALISMSVFLEPDFDKVEKEALLSDFIATK
ncbi:hypothetical protein [Pseudoalteromonas sp. T1lg122]|uniref:hypothetical protein n=1 Tax=Pseudoalteromonas sp. T1lg122 TaxID=2077094 RepID=UPI000CF62B57|nr:hypothetical protein [Pseudoalteromonas sp. T1lg122]